MSCTCRYIVERERGGGKRGGEGERGREREKERERERERDGYIWVSLH